MSAIREAMARAEAIRSAIRPMFRKGIGDRVFASTLPGYSSFGNSQGWSGVSSEQVLHFRHWFYIGLNVICNSVAELHPNLGYVTPAKESKHNPAAHRFKQWRYEKSIHQIKPHEEIEHVEPSHPLYQLIENPNAWDTGGFGDLMYELVMFLKLTGKAYLWTVPSELGVRTGRNTPMELWVIPSHWVRPVFENGVLVRYEIRPLTGVGVLNFPPEEVIPFRFKSPLDKFDGWSPLQAGGEWVDASDSVDLSRFFSFKNGCFPMGSLELSPEYNDPDDSDIERIYSRIFSRLQGETKYGLPLILPPGAKYNPLMINPTEMAYTDSADQLKDWVLSLLNVPKELVGLQPVGGELSWYAPMLMFCRRTLQPLLRYIGNVLTRSLCPRWDDEMRLWWDDPTPDNPEQVAKTLQQDFTNGVLTVDEYRAVRGYEPLGPPLGSLIWRQGTLVPIDTQTGKVSKELAADMKGGQPAAPPGQPPNPGGVGGPPGLPPPKETPGMSTRPDAAANGQQPPNAQQPQTANPDNFPERQESPGGKPSIEVPKPKNPTITVRKAAELAKLPLSRLRRLALKDQEHVKEFRPSVERRRPAVQETPPAFAPIVNVVVNVPEQRQPDVNVSVTPSTMPAPVVNLTMPEQRPPDVNVSVQPPNVTVEATSVTVEAPNVTVEGMVVHNDIRPSEVNVAAPIIPPAIVNVVNEIPPQPAPIIRVEAPQRSRTVKTIHRDEFGNIERVTEDEE